MPVTEGEIMASRVVAGVRAMLESEILRNIDDINGVRKVILEALKKVADNFGARDTVYALADIIADLIVFMFRQCVDSGRTPVQCYVVYNELRKVVNDLIEVSMTAALMNTNNLDIKDIKGVI